MSGFQEEPWDNDTVRQDFKDEVTTEEHELLPQG
jgi:hypothetical protein